MAHQEGMGTLAKFSRSVCRSPFSEQHIRADSKANEELLFCPCCTNLVAIHARLQAVQPACCSCVFSWNGNFGRWTANTVDANTVDIGAMFRFNLLSVWQWCELSIYWSGSFSPLVFYVSTTLVLFFFLVCFVSLTKGKHALGSNSSNPKEQRFDRNWPPAFDIQKKELTGSKLCYQVIEFLCSFCLRNFVSFQTLLKQPFNLVASKVFCVENVHPR